MAKKILKTREQFTSTMKTELLNEMKKISDDTDVPFSKLLDRAAKMLIDEMKNPNDKK